MASSLSQLPSDILALILQRLDLPDCLMFHKVCQSWRYAYLKSRSLTRPPPCLALYGIGPGTGKVYSLHGGQLLKLRSPELKLLPYERTVRSSMGWLVIVHNYCLSHLLNPISNEKIPLPSFDSGSVYHVALSAAPTSRDCIIVVTGSDPYGIPIYAYCRLSDSNWTAFNVGWDSGFEVCDMVFHQGNLYVSVVSEEIDCDAGEDFYIYTFDPQPKLAGSGSIASISKDNEWFTHRLVQSGRELLLVGWREQNDTIASDEEDVEDTYASFEEVEGTDAIDEDVDDNDAIDEDIDDSDATDDDGSVMLDVFKQTDVPGGWMRVESLGDRVLLMNNSCLDYMESFCTQDLMGSGFEPNCIYFPDFRKKKLVKFSMADRSCEQILFPLAPLDDEAEWIVAEAW